ncbi:MAG: CDP-diacylglycerol--glycerol-3-phosphate 3-phosphatidyltransferase [Bacilli bacterium]|nr:CDP-diacylglycerol--glycerol-3-phosphate 3-phosphatidyltransferase [Bacilli bacterium]
MKWFTKMNLPNKLTMIRMFCVILMLIVFFIDGPKFTIFDTEFSVTRLIVLILFAFGSFTDFLDGHIARKNNIVTTFGKFMDPIADKLLVNSLFILLTATGEIPSICTVIFIGRDIIVDSVRMICVEKQIVIAASKWGKLKTVLQMIALITTLIIYPFGGVCTTISLVLVILATIASLFSGIDYVYKNRKTVFEGMN